MGKRHAFEDIYKAKFRWPQFGDQLIVEQGDKEELAHLDLQPSLRLYMMTEGFKRSADICVQKAINGRNSDRDQLIYPIVFNYRQFLELSLKSIIAEYGAYVGVKPIWNSHRLERLWETFVNILDEYGTDDPDEIDVVVESCIAEFAKIDPDSFSFRYPSDTKGNALSFEQDFLNLGNLKDVMDALEGYFTGCDGFLDNRRSIMKDMEEDFQAELASDQ